MKIRIILLLILFNKILFCQSPLGGTSPVPSVSNLPSQVDSPPGTAMGTPEISIPLYVLDSYNKNLKISLSLIYNPALIRNDNTASEVGLGWSLTGASNVYREIKGIPDELENTTVSPPSINPENYLSDTYYFSTLSGNGKFKLVKNNAGNFEALNLDPLSFKINVMGVKHENYLDVDSIMITDNNGLKYHYKTKGISSVGVAFYYQNGSYTSQTPYKSVFYLDKIVDIDDRLVVKYYYDFHETGNYPSTHIYKLRKIESVNYGTIEYNYSFNEFSANSDPYSIKNIIVKNSNGLTINKFDFVYDSMNHIIYTEPSNTYISKRILRDIIKKGQNEIIIEKTSLVYDTEGTMRIYGSPEIPYIYNAEPLTSGDQHMNPKYESLGSLKSIILPSGGKINYTFVPNERATITARNTIEFEQSVQNGTALNAEDLYYLELKGQYSFDTNISRTISIATDNSFDFFIKFFPIELYPTHNPEEPGPLYPPDPFLDFKVYKKPSNNVINGSVIYEDDNFISKKYENKFPQNYNIQIEGWGNGEIEVYKLKAKNPPYYNAVIERGTGVRIDRIDYFSNKYNSIPDHSIIYEYLKNDLLRESSSSYIDNILFYQTVSIKTGEEVGKEVFYYTSKHFPEVNDGEGVYFPYKNLTKDPIFERKETYNSIGKKLEETISNVIYGSMPTRYVYFPDPNNSNTNYFTKTGFVKKSIDTIRKFDNSGSYMESIITKDFNTHNFAITRFQVADINNNTLETEYKYAEDKGNSKLLGVHMLSVPLEVTQTRNSINIGKVETFYNHSGNYFPSSVKSTGIAGATINEEKNDLYDNMGNVLQSSSRTGLSTTYIYGYNRTLLIAKVEGATYAEVMAAFGKPTTPDAYMELEIYTRSNLDVDAASEETLRQKLDDFRLKSQFKNYQITTYTYDPLIGVKSVTSPSGNKEYYYYDDANRLIRVEDINHNIIKENKYKQYLN